MLTMATHTIPGLDNCFKGRGLSTFCPELLNLLIAQLIALLWSFFLHCFRHSSKELWGRGWKLLLAPGGQCSCLLLEAFSRFSGEPQKPPWDWHSFQTNRWTKMNFYSKMAVGTWPRNTVSTEVGLRPEPVLGDRPAQCHQGSVPPSFKGKASALVNSHIRELSQ